MIFPLRLEEFVEAPRTAAAGEPARDLLEESRLDGFATGYQAGWEEAEAVRDQGETARRDALAAQLEGLALTYRQARADVLSALSPLVVGLVARCLPQIARAALPGLVAEALAPWTENGVSEEISLRCHPDDAGLLRGLCQTIPLLEIGPDDTVPEGQVWLTPAGAELRIDLQAALDDISRSVRDFFVLIEEDRSNG